MPAEIDPSSLAKWLVVGFKKNWDMWSVLNAHGIGDVDLDELHACCEFLPKQPWRWHATVRSFVATEWPKLNAYLIAHESDAARLEKVIPQVLRLKATGERAAVSSSADIAERRKDKRIFNATQASYRLSRDSFKTNQRFAWNTCKA